MVSAVQYCIFIGGSTMMMALTDIIAGNLATFR